MPHTGQSQSRESIDIPPAISVRPGRTVQAALAAVTKLNEGPLTAPTPQEARQWARKTFGFVSHYLEYGQWRYIRQWEWRVFKRTRLDDADSDLE